MRRGRKDGTYAEVSELAGARPPGVVAPGEAGAAGGEPGEGAAEEEDASEYAQNIEDREAGGRGFAGDFFDGLGGLVFGGRGAPLSCFHGGLVRVWEELRRAVFREPWGVDCELQSI